MRRITIFSCMVAAAVAVLAPTPKASAEDMLKVAIAQRGTWDLAAPELGQGRGYSRSTALCSNWSTPKAMTTSNSR